MAIIEVVKYNGEPDVLVWKYPNEELGTWTQLIVNESQEAILLKGGKVIEAFGGGRHTLDTANIPILEHIVNIPFGGRSPFTAEVWYINKLVSMDIKWGTPSPIQIQDPKYGVFAPVYANGVFAIQIEDSKTFLSKLIGTLSCLDKESLTKFFRGIYITKVKDVISEYFIKKQVSILEINAYIDDISAFLKESLEPLMKEYGIKLLHFNINEIATPEDDEGIIKLKSALAKRAEMNIIGFNYQQERSFDTLEGAANNAGSTASPILGAGMGLGMGVGLGGVMGNAFGNMSQQLNSIHNTSTIEKLCSKCSLPMQGTQRFCGNCGYDMNDSNDSKQPQPTKEVICSKCGNKIPQNSKFCPECGDQYNACPKCGADLLEGASECSECGYRMPQPCPKCKSPIEGNVKFCTECGETLVKSCPKCGIAIDGKPKFCPECGSGLN